MHQKHSSVDPIIHQETDLQDIQNRLVDILIELLIDIYPQEWTDLNDITTDNGIWGTRILDDREKLSQKPSELEKQLLSIILGPKLINQLITPSFKKLAKTFTTISKIIIFNADLLATSTLKKLKEDNRFTDHIKPNTLSPEKEARFLEEFTKKLTTVIWSQLPLIIKNISFRRFLSSVIQKLINQPPEDPINVIDSHKSSTLPAVIRDHIEKTFKDLDHPDVGALEEYKACRNLLSKLKALEKLLKKLVAQINRSTTTSNSDPKCIIMAKFVQQSLAVVKDAQNQIQNIEEPIEKILDKIAPIKKQIIDNLDQTFMETIGKDKKKMEIIRQHKNIFYKIANWFRGLCYKEPKPTQTENDITQILNSLRPKGENISITALIQAKFKKKFEKQKEEQKRADDIQNLVRSAGYWRH
ncbi:MAG: hypothetical protein JW855_02835 [Gammaproteobacteria bacterium]|nr:hypothetical protein [Gammaproteobacteria bacterium]